MTWITINTRTFSFMLLFLVCVLVPETQQAISMTLEHPDGTAEPPTPITLRENTIAQTALTIVICNVTDCTCNLDRTQPTQGPFDVWRLATQTDFKAYFLGTSQATQQLKYSNIRTYLLYIKCVEAGDTTADGTSTITLEVDILPNQQPDVTDYPAVTTAEFTGNSADAIGTVIYTVTAVDEENDALTYTMTQNPDSGYFQIGKTTGIITTAVDMRTIVVEDVILTVSVSDGNNDPVDLIVTVKLKDLNTRPFISNLPATIQVPEDSAVGTILTTLTFGDATPQSATLLPDCVVDPVADDFKFTYDSGTRNYKLASVSSSQVLLDYETTNKYVITCKVNDGYLDSVDDVLTVEVTNINEPPVFDLTTYYCVLEESKPSVSFCDLGLTVTDPEGDAITTMELQSGGNSARFRYDRVKNALTFAVDYDVDQSLMPTTDTVVLLAVDSQRATGSATIDIIVQDVNDNVCSFTTSQAAIPVVSGQTNTYLGSVVGVDNDLTSPNNDVIFGVERGVPLDSLSYITMTNDGQIQYIGVIPDSNHGKSYGLEVICKDRGNPPQTSTGTVFITFSSTTSTTTSTTTTTTATTTATTTTTESSIWKDDAFVAVFATLMTLLALGLLIAMWYFCCRGNQIDCFPNQPRTPPRQVKPSDQYHSRRYDDDDFFRSGNPRSSADYRDHAWRQGDHYEDGMGYDGGRPTSNGDIFLSSGGRPRALPPPVERGYY